MKVCACISTIFNSFDWILTTFFVFDKRFILSPQSRKNLHNLSLYVKAHIKELNNPSILILHCAKEMYTQLL
jgi:hypothetical protein